MSFSSVDSSASPTALVSYLDRTTVGQWAMKNYVSAALSKTEPRGPILDLGCGAGHDIALLGEFGLEAIGLDVSAVMLVAAQTRVGTVATLVQGDGAALPFRDESFGGCRMERVLMHVHRPDVVIGEVVRCMKAGSAVAIFEPDWKSFRVRASDGSNELCDWLNSARHSGIGADLWRLLEAAGCEVLDQVEELSVWTDLGRLDAIVGGADAAVARAVAAGRVDADYGQAWLERQRCADRAGAFRALMRKMLVIARRT